LAAELGPFSRFPDIYQNIYKIYPMAVKSTKWSYNLPTSSTARPSKIYANLDFWFENIPSGNPAFLPKEISAATSHSLTRFWQESFLSVMSAVFFMLHNILLIGILKARHDN
jgi:hypothetical protein